MGVGPLFETPALWQLSPSQICFWQRGNLFSQSRNQSHWPYGPSPFCQRPNRNKEKERKRNDIIMNLTKMVHFQVCPALFPYPPFCGNSWETLDVPWPNCHEERQIESQKMNRVDVLIIFNWREGLVLSNGNSTSRFVCRAHDRIAVVRGIQIRCHSRRRCQTPRRGQRDLARRSAHRGPRLGQGQET